MDSIILDNQITLEWILFSSLEEKLFKINKAFPKCSHDT